MERFGVTVDWRSATMEAITTISLQADHSGLGYFWVTEAWGLEAFMTLGHILSITKRIKAGPGIANVYSRSAATIGMACATMEQLAPGRAMLGLGASGRGLVESFHGVRFEKPLKRTEEYVDVIRKVQSGEIVDYNGEFLKLSRFRLYTKPNLPVPIYLGALGEKNLALAGRISDGAIVTMYPMSKLGQCFHIVNRAEPSKKKKIFAYIPVRITNNDREEAAARLEVAKFVSFLVSSMGSYYARNLERLGFGKQVEEIRAASKDGSSEGAKVITQDFLSEFALIGTSRKIIERLATIPDGVHPVFVMAASSVKEADESARAIREITVATTKH